LLRIDESGMIFFNYGFLNSECIFWIMDWKIWNAFFNYGCFEFFLFWINTVIHVLLKAPIQEITGHVNLKFYRKRQSENLPDFIIRNKKNKCTVLYRNNLVFAQPYGGAGRKRQGYRKKLPSKIGIDTKTYRQIAKMLDQPNKRKNGGAYVKNNRPWNDKRLGHTNGPYSREQKWSRWEYQTKGPKAKWHILPAPPYLLPTPPYYFSF